MSWAAHWLLLPLKANMQHYGPYCIGRKVQGICKILIKTQSAQSQEMYTTIQHTHTHTHFCFKQVNALVLTINRSGAKPPSKLFAAFVSNTRPSLRLWNSFAFVWSLQSSGLGLVACGLELRAAVCLFPFPVANNR